MQALTRVTIGCLIGALLVLMPSPAHAGEYPDCDPGETPTPISGADGFCAAAQDPPTPPTETPGNHQTGTQRTCMYEGKKIPCVSSEGVWFSSRQCYAQPSSPPFQPDDAVWGNNDPTKGSMWTCGRVFTGGHEDGIYFFYVLTGDTPALIDPGELAQEAMESMAFAVPDIHVAPSPPDLTYVNLETWLWMSKDRFAMLTLPVTAGGTTVTVTAEPTSAYWHAGDGGGTECSTTGVAWKSWMDDSATTDCSYTYKTTSTNAKNGKFKVSAFIWYQVDWTCSGACLQPSGTLGEVASLASSTRIRVGERQSVIVGGDS